jgi:protease-4
VYSISLRPYGSRLTLSSDAVRYSGESYRELDYSYSISLRMPYELSLFLRGDREKNVMFGMTLPFYLRKGNGSGLKLEGYGSHRDEKSRDFAGVGFSYTDRINERAFYSAPGRNMLLVRIAEAYNETEIHSYFSERKLTFYDLLRGMNGALRDRTIDGLIIRIDQADLGFAQLQELRELMKKFRSAGKEVVSILTATGNKEYFLASESDRIYLSPNAPFGLQGLKAEVYFFKKLADSAGVRFESIRRGRYKSFAESWTREKMSPEFRENMNQILGDLNEQFLGLLSGSRGVSRKEINAVLSRGVLTPEEAREMKVVDKVMYPDEAMKDIGTNLSPVNLKEYLNENRSVHSWGPVPVIAVVYVDGSIIRGKSKITRYARGIGDESYAEVLEQVFRDSSVKALVLRIDSGGGSAAASDFMWRSLISLKEKYKKPVVISFGNIAASGGYYIACTGDRIFSSPGTITGSIGVIFGKVSVSELYGKLGINKEVIKMNRFADIMSESRKFTEEEKKVLQKGIDFTYSQFLDRVRKARKIESDKIESVTEGKIFTGNQAGKNRLVDEMGGLLTAIEYAKTLAGIEREFVVRGLPEYTAFMDSIVQTTSPGPFGSIFGRLYGEAKIDLLLNSDYLFLFPYVLKIR